MVKITNLLFIVALAASIAAIAAAPADSTAASKVSPQTTLCHQRLAVSGYLAVPSWLSSSMRAMLFPCLRCGLTPHLP